MKRTIILLMVVMASVITMSAQEEKKTIYVIDGKQVENFDGSQLQGKTIVHYSVEPQLNIHNIVTSDVTGGKAVKGVRVIATKKVIHKEATDPAETIQEHVQAKEGEVVYVMDGKIVPYSEVKNMPTSKVYSMEILKNKQSADYQKYAKEAVESGKLTPKSIVKITTK